MSQELLEAARAAAARGFRIFPLLPGGKAPAIKEWQKRATSDLSIIDKVWGGATDYNIGVLCDGMIVLDVDVKNGKPGMESLAALDLDLDLNTYTVQTPTGGLHVYYTNAAGEVSNSAGTRLGAGLDVRARGGYVVGEGSVIDGVAYQNFSHLNHGRDDRRPIVAPPSLVARLATTSRKADGGRSVPTDTDTDTAIAVAKGYLLAAPAAIEGKGGDHTTFTTAAFLRDFGVSEGTAFDLLVEHWNERCDPPWKLEDLRDKVANAYLYAENAPGSKDFTTAFQGITLDPPPSPPPPRTSGLFAVQYFEPQSEIVDDPWMFYKLLPAEGVAVLVGPSGSGKSFLLNKLAYCLAEGQEFLGTEPDERGGTIFLYAGTEGSGFQKRMTALGATKHTAIGRTGVTALRERGAMQSLTACLQREAQNMRSRYGIPLRMVVLETLSASGLMEDENNAALASAAMEALALLGQALGVLIVVSHHPPKEGKGSRGSGSIIGSADYVIEVHREGGAKVREIELTKARNAEERRLGSFSLSPVVLGHDSRGRPIDTMVVSLGDVMTPLAKKAAHTEKFMEAVEMLTAPDGTAPFAEVQTTFGSLVPGTGDRARQFKDAYEYALSTGLVDLTTEGGHHAFRRKTL